jgi:hypothetical protein
LAEKGSRFSELEMRLNTDDTQVAWLSETGCNVDLGNFNIDGFHPLDPS